MTRLDAPFGSRIDRSRLISFSFEGRGFSGYEGDTIASALAASGQWMLSRSFKYHRPRGAFSMEGAKVNTLVQVGSESNLAADLTSLTDGMVVSAQNVNGSLARDRDAVMDRLGRFMPVGFYYRSFMGPTCKAWLNCWEPLIRAKARFGVVDLAAKLDGFEKTHLHSDILVVGAGPAGLTAAIEAAEAGADVILCDEGPEPGGRLTFAPDEEIDLSALIARAEALPGIRVMTATICNGWFEDSWLPLIRGKTLHRCRAREVILATGGIEQPAVFRGNERRGVAHDPAWRRTLMTARSPIVLLHTDAPEAARSIVAAAHPDLTLHTCDSYAGLPAMLEETGAEVVYSVRFAGTPGFPRAALLDSAAMRWISVGGSGTDHLAPWDPTHVTVTNAAGVAADMMAEYALGAMLTFSLDLRGFAKAQAERRWTAGRVTPIEGRTLLILGLGQTGQAAARRAKAMGMTTLGVRARPRPTKNVDEVHGMEALSGLWPRADFVLVCVPLLPSTQRIVDAAAFAAMRPGAVLIDTSRGGICDEAALIRALRDGPLKGAALDVFATEPLPADHPFWAMENVIVTPHCSSVYDGWAEKSVSMFAENLKRYRRGDALDNVVDPLRGY